MQAVATPNDTQLDVASEASSDVPRRKLCSLFGGFDPIAGKVEDEPATEENAEA